MVSPPLVFVDVDTQHDFLHESGSLSIPGAGVILPNLERLTRFARERGIPVIATSCAHTLDEEDPEPFPPHCLVGTEGQRRIPATQWPEGLTLSPGASIATLPELPPHLTLEKTRYDLFSRPDADLVVELYGRARPTFVVYGVATDYCVRAVVLGLLARGQKVVVVVDAVYAIDVENEADQFRDFVGAGAQLVATDVVTKSKDLGTRLAAFDDRVVR